MAGYSATPLAKKLGLLGLKAPLVLLTIRAPKEYSAWLGPLPAGVRLTTRAPLVVQAAHVFATRRSELARDLTKLRAALQPAGFVWASWQKRTSAARPRVALAKLDSSGDVTENVIREVALPMGFVDVKVCAVSDVWSGLKLVIRKSQRFP